MNKRKNKQFVYRDGNRIPRDAWDKYQRELREVDEYQRLKAMGLVTSKPKIAVAEKSPKQIITLDELRE